MAGSPQDRPDRVLRNGRLADGRHVDVHVSAGTVVDVVPTGTGDGHPDVPTTDLAGWLLVGAPAEPHAHLDKALTAEQGRSPTTTSSGGRPPPWRRSSPAGSPRSAPTSTSVPARTSSGASARHANAWPA